MTIQKYLAHGKIIAINGYSTVLPKPNAENIFSKQRKAEVRDYSTKGLMPCLINNKVEYKPMLTPTSLKRCLFRNPNADRKIEAEVSKGNRISFENALLWKTGQTRTEESNLEKKKAKEKDGDKKVKEEKQGDEGLTNIARDEQYRDLNKLIDMHGTFQHAGRLRCEIAIAEGSAELVYLNGVKKDGVAEIAKLFNEQDRKTYQAIISAASEKAVLQAEIDELKAANDEALEKDKTANLAANNELIAQKNAQIKALTDTQDGFKVSLLMPIPTRWIAPAGTTFSHHWSVPADKTHYLSMALQGLNEFSNTPELGGLRTFAGRMIAYYDVTLSGSNEVLFRIWMGDYRDAIITNGQEDAQAVIKVGLSFFDDKANKGFLKLSAEGKSHYEQAIADTSWFE